MCNTHKCLLPILVVPSNLMVETSNNIKQPPNPMRSTGPRLGRRGPIHCGRCAASGRRKDLGGRRPGSGGPAPGDAVAAWPSPWQHHLPVCSCPAPTSGVDYEIAWRPDKGFRERSPGPGVRSRVGARWRESFGPGSRGLTSLSPPHTPPHSGFGAAMENGGRPSLGQFILLGSSSVVTAVLYSVYRQKAQVAQELKVSAVPRRSSLAPVMVSPQLAWGRSTGGHDPKEEIGPGACPRGRKWRPEHQNWGIGATAPRLLFSRVPPMIQNMHLGFST